MLCETYTPRTQELANPHIQGFTLFNKLPFDLRLMVWNLCIPPRVVEILFNRRTGVCRSTTPIPVLLHLNQEARYFALKHYQLAFGNDNCEPLIYFDFKIDTLYIGAGNVECCNPGYLFTALGIQDTQKVKHLASDHNLAFYKNLIYMPDPMYESDSSSESVS